MRRLRLFCRTELRAVASAAVYGHVGQDASFNQINRTLADKHRARQPHIHSSHQQQKQQLCTRGINDGTLVEMFSSNSRRRRRRKLSDIGLAAVGDKRM